MRRKKEETKNCKFKIAWVSWETVCLSKEKGVLGIRALTKFNQALLGKWKWDLFHHQGELWARVLDSKYGGWQSLDGNNTPQAVSKWWYDPKKVCHNSGEESWFKQGISRSVGSGSKARF